MGSPDNPLVATYSGDANYNASTSSLATPQSQAAATITVTSSANPATFAEPVTFSVTVAPPIAAGTIPTGSVQATVFGSETLGAVFLDATGHASFQVASIPKLRGRPLHAVAMGPRHRIECNYRDLLRRC